LTGTFLASNVSAALFLGATDVAAKIGYAFWCAYVPTSIGFLLCLGYIGPAVRRLSQAQEVFTFPEILSARFSSRKNSLRLTAALAIPLLYLPYVAAQLDGVASVLDRILGLDSLVQSLSFIDGRELGLCGVMGILLFYTMWGGMKAVVWTDFVQMMALTVGILLLVPFALSYVGNGNIAAGTDTVLSAAPQKAFTLTSAQWPWMLVFGQFVWLFAIPAQPHLLTRVLAARNEYAIRKALPWCLLGMFVVYLSTIPVGLIGRTLFPDLSKGSHYYVEIALLALPPAAAGLALAGVAAAALSTGDTEIALAGQAVSRDLYQRHLKPDASPRTILGLSRMAVLLTAIITFTIAWIQPAGIYWMGRASAALFASAFFVPLVGGILWKRSTGTGAVLSVIAGLLASLTISILALMSYKPLIPEFIAGILSSATAFMIGSLLTSPTNEELIAVNIMHGKSKL
jgi:Na+/proline symporter